MDPKRIKELQKQVTAFGGVRTPLDEIIGDKRIVVAGSQVLEVPAKWTFGEFLISYGRSRLGIEWISEGKSSSNPHPLVSHLTDGFTALRPTGQTDGPFIELTMNADLYAFISFAYDLFTVADNARVQTSLLDRIRHIKLYQGARYELFAAASLLRAGFRIEFEDESDSTRSHCEFTATHKKTGRSYSVEAKSRHRDEKAAGTPQARMYKILQQALRKHADYERIVFVDVNLPPDRKALFEEDWHKEIGTTLKALEENQRADNPWPQAIVFFTNRKTSPWHGQSDENQSTVLLTAINHPLFQIPDRGPVEQAYPEIGRLFHAANHLSEPPALFFGQ
jgi:hypothetical protein